MAKRTRGSTRPGQRAPLQRGTTRPSTGAAAGAGAAASAMPRPASLTAAEEARAAELEAQIVAEERAAEEAQRRTRDRTRRPAEGAGVASGSISVRAAEEYGYVVRDIRRIAMIGGGLIVVLLVLWVVIEATGIGPF